MPASPPRPVLLDILDDPSTYHSATAAFLHSITTKIQLTILTSPPIASTAKTARPTKQAEVATRSSGRLAAKPTAGLSTLDKAKLVLLKKARNEAEENNLVGALKNFDEIYKKTLPPTYINAMVSLVEAAAPGRKGRVSAMKQVTVA
jgi:hypothetical protein